MTTIHPHLQEQIRIPKPETRKNPEYRNPNRPLYLVGADVRRLKLPFVKHSTSRTPFDIRISDFFRISDFGLRISTVGLRIFIPIISWCLISSAYAQLQFINLTSTTTNITTSSANITIPGVCSNATYYVTNYNNVIVGDTIAAAFAKMNSDLAYCSNEFGFLINLPNQINTNWQSYSVSLSNFVANVGITNSLLSSNLTLVSSNFLLVSNSFIATSNRFVTLSTNFLNVSNNFVIVSNNFAAVSNTVSRFFATNAPLHLPDIYDVSNKVGILQSSPAYALDVNGPIHFTGGSSSANLSMVLANDGVGTMQWSVYNGTSLQPVRFGLAGGAGFFASTGGGGVVYFDSTQAKLGRDATSQVFLVNGSGGMDMIDSSGSGAHLDGSGNFSIDNTFSSDSGNFYSDGSGNVTCNSLTQTSDLNTKTNITALDPATVLQKLVAIPVYRWTFRDYNTTNSFSSSSSTNAGAPGTAPARTNGMITHHLLSTTPHFGPMAQDWSGKFGGRTNGISVIDLQGLLLAGLQALSQQTGTFTNATGAKFHLIVNTATNGFVFVPQ